MNFEQVTDTPLFRSISSLDTEFVRSTFTTQKISKGQVLYYQGDIADSMCIVRSGLLVKSFESGHRTFHLSYQRPGDTIGEAEVLHSKRIRYVTTTARTDAAVWRISARNLDQLLSMYPTIFRRLFDAVGERFVRAKRKITYLAFMDARLRIVHLLYDYLQDHHDSTPVWQITQQEMSEMVALNRESVARIIGELQNDGVIHSSRGRIAIIDTQKLKTIANTEGESS
ncbi:Crp/Fnr family transcriptional regulator [Alicyclobacillus ferrooxydans]|uniref:Crp/Fnr family transcriptional regulator n=1 Tax=Alicyclobacillus ferrooxydans TaxID=471514 RepID=A0A0P9CJG0_9BACL|nr:Crp/Fnr family transcriptional regulator [Alicyclobacillus ferrooxydans]KPV43154.1 hypothetical protein AN477_13765 [Alicyclobacillus ferrooxydans]